MNTWESAERYVRLLGGRWTTRLIIELHRGPCRYQDLHESMRPISHKVLTDTVRRAERDGLISRKLAADRLRSTTAYELTELAYSLDGTLNATADWTSANWAAVEAARAAWDDRID
jgi:DNA-binding HxlR family transcriptional regulator